MNDGFSESSAFNVLKWSFAILVAIFMAAPSFIVVPMSFSSAEMMQFPPAEYSLRWYRNFFTSNIWTDAAKASLTAAILTMAIAVPTGTFAAYGTMKLGRKVRVLIGGLIVLPALIPVILISIGLFFVLSRIGMVGTMAGLVAGHVSLAIPVVYVVMTAAFSQFDYSHEKAARSLGASWAQSWLLVVLPQMTGPIVASAVLAFVTSLDEVVIAMFVSGGSNATLPKVMFTALRDTVDPTIAVVSTALLLVASITVVVAVRKGNYGRR
ncbi:MAG: ABC transporter permease [Shinella sp.]|nr:MAG: ABC transporter permease [Shinella sp.]